MYNFIWYNLPKQIKDKFSLDAKWRTIIADTNTVLRVLESTDNATYSLYYKPGYKTNWRNLLTDLDKALVILEN